MSEQLGDLEDGIRDRKSFLEILRFSTSFIGSFFSILLVILIVYWAIKIPEKNINDLPIINAIKGEIKSLPIEPGGKEFINEKLSIYEGIDGKKEIEKKDEITVENSVSVSHINLKQEIRKNIKKDTEPVSLNDAINSVIKQYSEEQTQIKMNALYLGSFDSYQQAKSFWDVIEKKNKDILKKLTYKIYEKDVSGVIAYRLQLEDFDTKENGKNLCSILNSRQFACLLVSENE